MSKFSGAWILQANLSGQTFFWTGKAGEAWVSLNTADALPVSWDEAHRKAELFNGRVELTSMIFEVFRA